MSQSESTDPYPGCRYVVEIDSMQVAGFSEVSGLTAERQTVQYDEGGVEGHVHHLPGQVSHSNLVLKRGLTTNVDFWNWLQTTINGMHSDQARKNIRVKLYNSKNEKPWGWEFKNAYPVKWSGPKMSGADGRLAIEMAEFAHDGFTKMSGMP